jgi:hypothetical protein
VFLYPLDRVSWVFRPVSPGLLVPADAGQHRRTRRGWGDLVRSPVAVVVERAGTLSAITRRGRYQLETWLLAFGGWVAQPRNRYEPGGEPGRCQFA